MTDREDPQSLRDRIVDTAIDLAEQEGWENLRLRKVAERCGVALTDVLSEFRDIDAVANAWFERALAAMLQPPEPGFQGRPAGGRVHSVMMRWFEATAAHRRLTGEMIRTKLYRRTVTIPSTSSHIGLVWVNSLFPTGLERL